MGVVSLIYNEILGKFQSSRNVTSDPFVTEGGTQTLTNKTLTSPAVTGQTGSLSSPVITSPSGAVTCLEALFTQVAGNKTHTATFSIPAGATILDIWITNTVVWNSDTSATMKIGLVDDDCFFTALDVKTVPGAGKSINLAWPGNVGGASVPEIDGGAGNQQLGATNGFFYNASAASLAAVITDVNVSGTNGRTRVTVLYSLPSTVVSPTVA